MIMKMFSPLLVSLGCSYMLASFSITFAHANNSLEGEVGHLQSFVVSANYGVQSSNSSLPSTRSWRESRQYPGRHFPTKNPSLEVIYGSRNPSSMNATGQRLQSSVDRTNDQVQAASTYEVNEVLDDIHKPSVADLQGIISKLIKGSTKVHQVVKVPAVYEIHLQEEKPSSGFKNFKAPLPGRTTNYWKQQALRSTRKPYWKPQVQKIRPHHNWGGRKATKTWNLPSKIKYFDKQYPIQGKYSHPKPFSIENNQINTIPLNSWTIYPHQSQPLYSSVSVPMTPGSTAVSFISNGRNYENYGDAVGLNLYYAKKKELEDEGYIGQSIGQRRNVESQAYKAKDRGHLERRYFPLYGFNYIIHVREKSS